MLITKEDQLRFCRLVGKIRGLNPKHPITDYEWIYNDLRDLSNQIATDRKDWEHEPQQGIEEWCLERATKQFLQFLHRAEFNDPDEYDHAFQTERTMRKHVQEVWQPYLPEWAGCQRLAL